MKDFITEFKNKARNKSLTSADMLARCVYKTIKAKCEDKQVVLDHFIKKTFSPGAVCAHRYHPYQAMIEANRSLQWQLTSKVNLDKDGKMGRRPGTVLGISLLEILTDEEEALFRATLSEYRITP